MTAIIKFLCRLIPAVTFIFSGFVKAVDPTGGSVKFHDYFVAFNMDWLIPIAMPLAILLAIIEFILGTYLLLGLSLRKVIPAVLGFMSFFTVLTLYIAIYNPVTDCGCFGDALKITNWQTFWKNVIVLIFTLGAWFFRKEYRAPGTTLRRIATSLSLVIYISSVVWYSLANLPIFDFRPLKPGAHVESLISIPEGAEMPEFETIFILEKDGQRETFTVENYPYDDTTWVFIDSETRIIKEGYVPPLEALAFIDDEMGDITHDIIYHPEAVFLLISPDLTQMASKSIEPLSELAKAASEQFVPFYCVTASDSQVSARFEREYHTGFHFLSTDAITLKTMIRSNPGLIMIYDGVVIAKWHYNNLPEAEIMKNPLSYALTEKNQKRDNLVLWVHIFTLILIPVVFLTSRTINNRK
ncbi:BT_3928 family protein [Alkalitalea saponilacus]|uniref:Uncharacterized membrane protein YphA, DoxX/SURF4 family n=1 Tax=Alkalitalea saponilacus TaxID=889453 RepID=A0A1T5H8U0_9BACT|nr:BT_3928 family protein [Alkalitalea saponilacus]ASB50832.1 DoxX family protein [Alkalitalea saponilacus]SKC17125.1 Uncharacterized membrane protein YphA, DoxX/SURF4 family [Alkalitalea saponilacus]